MPLRMIGATIGLLIVGGCLMPPRAVSETGAAPQEPAVHTYRNVDGTALRAFVFTPSQRQGHDPAPAILLFHGGGWVAGTPDWVFTAARRFAAVGFVAIPIEYRLSTDRISPIDAFADVCEALKWTRREAATMGLNPNRIAAYGVSAGGHLAALAATVGCGVMAGEYGIGGPDALVLWSPAVDVSQDGWFKRLLGERALVADYSPVEHVRSRMPPVSIVQGARDNLTPLSGARRFCARVVASQARCELNVYEGVGHLLTRNLTNQESDFDPDPVAQDDGVAKQLAFVQGLWRR